METTLSDKLIESFRNINPNLKTLWETLCKNRFLYQEGPYPAGHGKEHIINVLGNLNKFFSSCDKQFTSDTKSIAIAAAMIHDINMIPLRSQGSEGCIAQKTRDEHAIYREIEKLADEILSTSGFKSKIQRENIIEIASAHAKDTERMLDEKMRQLEKREQNTGFNFLIKLAVLVQASDFFDIGPDRLTHDVSRQKWNSEQIEHYKKHTTVCLNILENEQSIKLWLSKEDAIEINGEKLTISPMEKYKIIYMVNAQACNVVSQLNKMLGTQWTVEFDKTILGEISPMGKGINLFATSLAEALNEWPSNKKPFPIDFMGHSLYGRFVEDGERLNPQLKDLLSASGMNFRIIILDPSIESQQMREIYDGQRNVTQEESRSILPRYTPKKGIDEKGDILSSLEVLKEWLNQSVGLNSSMEIRATTRIMYMGLARFGNTIIVTPYRQKGLFNDSISIIFKNNVQSISPLYRAYEDVFSNLWEDRLETRLLGYKNSYDSKVNPLNFLIPDVGPKSLKPFDYERYFLTEYKDRLKTVFNNVGNQSNQIIPPVEVEIQPSEDCTLTCEHCIGRYLNQEKQIHSKKNGEFSSLLDYEAGGYKIDRFRISGLIGDPLVDSTREVTLNFIEEAKKKNRTIVLLTNGVGLCPFDSRLLMADYIHVSLDAATPKTYETIKGVNCFKQIEQNLLQLCSKNKNKSLSNTKSTTNVGVGFVVTQSNFFEVSEAISKAKKLGVDFIRFKPDIRGMQKIGWRNWKEALAKIKRHQHDEKHNKNFDIIITDTGASDNGIPAVSRCWSQYFYSTIGADNQIYPCDHLSTAKYTSIGECHNFGIDWKKAVNDGIIGQRHRQCVMCPPLSQRLNRLIDQLYSLYENQQCDWDILNKWITEFLYHYSSRPSN